MKKTEKNYVCDTCMHEQESSDFCEDCQIKMNLYNPVSPKFGTQEDIDAFFDEEVEEFGDIIAYDRNKHKNKVFGKGEDYSDDYTRDTVDSLMDAADADFVASRSTFFDEAKAANAANANPYPIVKKETANSAGGAIVWKKTNPSTNTVTTAYTSGYKYTPKPVSYARRPKVTLPHDFWFIGDVHKNVDELLDLIDDIREIDKKSIIIQVGDIGIGELDKPLPNLGKNVYFIQGNHDHRDEIESHPSFLGLYGFKHGIFFCGGAMSKGFQFPGEEMSQDELDKALALYKKTKPELVVTHDCPESLRNDFFGSRRPKGSRTALTLQKMWEFHKPAVWNFGHMHSSHAEVFDGCLCVLNNCLTAQKLQLGWNTNKKFSKTNSKPFEKYSGYSSYSPGSSSKTDTSVTSKTYDYNNWVD